MHKKLIWYPLFFMMIMLGSVLAYSVVGKAVAGKGERTQNNLPATFCVDTDGGGDFFVTGEVTFGMKGAKNRTIADECVANSLATAATLKEAMCADELGITKFFDCASVGAVCRLGACVYLPAPSVPQESSNTEEPLPSPGFPNHSSNSSPGKNFGGNKGGSSGGSGGGSSGGAGGSSPSEPLPIENNTLPENNESESNQTQPQTNQTNQTQPPDNQSSQSFFCTDTDGGKNYLKNGTIAFSNANGSGAKSDYCIGNDIQEMFCIDASTGAYSTESKSCASINSSYICQDGACVPDVTNPVQPQNNQTNQTQPPDNQSSPSFFCTDTDGGKNTAVNGSVSYKNATHAGAIADYCKSQTLVAEAYCDGYSGYYSPISCGVNSTCQNGACVANQTAANQTNASNTCTDSDGGKNYGIKGTVFHTNGSTFTDSCSFSGVLQEFMCSAEGLVNITYFKCADSGTICSDGACISNQTNTSNTTGKVTDITGYTDPDQGNITFTAVTEGAVTSVKFQINCNLGSWQDIGTDSSAPFQATYAGGPACDAMRVQATAMPSGANYVEGPFKYLG